jgi:glycosyltransferase involved in cell wall biosynthesis
MWEWNQNPIVIPNGISAESIVESDPAVVASVRAAAGAGAFWFKIGRFDPDKRWLMAVSAAAELKRRGEQVKLMMRGGREPHGTEVLGLAEHLGLDVKDVPAPDDATGLVATLKQSPRADILNFTSFLDESLVRVIYGSVDAVLANSGHEPFGLVGLEVMAAGGIAVTGATGEDYAEPYRNALVLETDDPLEIVTELAVLKERPRVAAHIRRRGRVTARDYVWEKVIEQLLLRVEFAAERQAVRLPPAPPRKRVSRARTLRSLTESQ